MSRNDLVQAGQRETRRASGPGRRLPLLALLLLLPALRAAATSPAPAPELKLPPAASYNIYLRGEPVGQMKATLTRTTFEGAPAYLKESELRIKINAGGEVEETTKSRRYLSLSGAVRFERTETASARATQIVETRYFPDRVECAIDASGQKSTKTVPIPAGVMLALDQDITRLVNRVKVGDREDGYHFNENRLTFDRREAEVIGREMLKSGDRAIDAFVVRLGRDGREEGKEWITADGELLQGELNSLSMRLVRDDLPPPPKSGAGPVDLMEAAAVKTERAIEDPRLVYLLKVKMTGLPDRTLVLSDARQRATVEERDGALTVTYQLHAAFPPLHGAARLKDSTGEPMLQDAPYLGIDDPAIRKQAQEIAGDETDRAVVARKIHDWVYSRLKWGNAGLYRSAKEIMEHQDGVCREYATLFAALARAAGIPTRLCGGVLYANGAFYYHAWNECRLTDEPDGWYPFDATLKSDFADATHIKFSQGDVTDMYQSAARLVGLLQAEVLDYR